MKRKWIHTEGHTENLATKVYLIQKKELKILTLKNVIMKKMLIFGAALVLVMGMTSCDDNHNSDGPQIIHNAVKDYDGNKYDAVKIGKQVWMASNLKTEHYADGSEIPMAGNSTYSETEPYRYCPDGNSQNVNYYGYLYNWPAVMHGSSSSENNPSGVQGICPKGWHVPSEAEWNELGVYVYNHPEQYGNSVAKALASNDGCWEESGTLGTPGCDQSSNNTTGFSAVPAGRYYGSFDDFGPFAYFWSATQYDSNLAYSRFLDYLDASVYRRYYNKNYGVSVRCVRD